MRKTSLILLLVVAINCNAQDFGFNKLNSTYINKYKKDTMSYIDYGSGIFGDYIIKSEPNKNKLKIEKLNTIINTRNCYPIYDTGIITVSSNGSTYYLIGERLSYIYIDNGEIVTQSYYVIVKNESIWIGKSKVLYFKQNEK